MESIWLSGGKRNDGGAHKQVFFPKWEENLVEGNLMGEGQKCPYAVCCFFFFVFFFVFGFSTLVKCFFCSHSFFFRRDFFFLDIILKKKFGWLYFFFWSLFYFNWASLFNKDIWVNLYKLIFFIPPLFHSQPNKNEGNNNLFYTLIFISSHNFLSFYLSIRLTKRTSLQK